MSRSEAEESTSPFERVATEAEAPEDRHRRLFDEYVMAPLRILWDDGRARVGGAILLLYVLTGTVGVMVVPTPKLFETRKYLMPLNPAYTVQPFGLAPFTVDLGTFSWTYAGIWEYPLGADNQGRGLLRQTIHATDEMLLMMLAGAVFTVVVATVIGTASGYKGGTVDRGLMYLTDIAMTLPTLPLIIVLAATVQPSNPVIVGLLLSVNTWGGLSRTVRSQVLSLREESYVEASRTIGVPTRGILAKDILPNIMPYIVVNFVQVARRVIFASVGLYFLGFLPFTTTNWGVQLNIAFSNGAMISPSTWHWIGLPMLAVVMLSFGLIMFGQGTDRIFNPRIRVRHTKTGEGEDAPAPTDPK